MGTDRIISIVVTTGRPEALSPFCDALTAAPKVSLGLCASLEETLELIRTRPQNPPSLVVIDHRAVADGPFNAAARLLACDARVGSAVVTPLSEEEAHDQGEGLGLVAVLPDPPAAADAARLLAALAALA
jgi:hypothetical protein